MANVLNRTRKQFLASANTPDYPVVDWIHNPDMSAVTGFDSRYWIITGDTVTLMDAASRAALDAAAVDAARDALANLKTTVGGITDLPIRTAAQVRAAIRSKLGV